MKEFFHMQTSYLDFVRMFKFDLGRIGNVGCEREFFLTDRSGQIRPLAVQALKALPKESFGYELSACQAEMRIGPVTIGEFGLRSRHVAVQLAEALHPKGIGWSFATVAPVDMPLDVYPDPTGRYQRITETLPPEVLLAACRVAGTHVHVGMSDLESALRVYRHAVQNHFDELCEMGNLSNGERLGIYRKMAPNWRPEIYSDTHALHSYYVTHGYDVDPRKCWHLIRLSVHGTIEFRMFDNTGDLDVVDAWVRKCHNICMSAM